MKDLCVGLATGLEVSGRCTLCGRSGSGLALGRRAALAGAATRRTGPTGCGESEPIGGGDVATRELGREPRSLMKPFTSCAAVEATVATPLSVFVKNSRDRPSPRGASACSQLDARSTAAPLALLTLRWRWISGRPGASGVSAGEPCVVAGPFAGAASEPLLLDLGMPVRGACKDVGAEPTLACPR